MNANVAKWIAQFPEYHCLTNPVISRIFDDDPVYKLTMTYIAYTFYLDKHPNHTVPELRSVVRELARMLVERAPCKSHLLLLCGERPLMTTLGDVKQQYPTIIEVEMAIELFGLTAVAPMPAILEFMGEPDWSLARVAELRNREIQRIRVEKSEAYITRVRALAAREACNNAKAVLLLLKRIQPKIWSNFLPDICHAVRNTGDCEWTQRSLVYIACPKKLHARVELLFQGRCGAYNGMQVLQKLAKH